MKEKREKVSIKEIHIVGYPKKGQLLVKAI